MTLATTYMNKLATCINVTNMKRQRFFQAKPHCISGEQENTIAHFFGSPDEPFNFCGGKNIRNSPNLRGLNNVQPLPIAG